MITNTEGKKPPFCLRKEGAERIIGIKALHSHFRQQSLYPRLHVTWISKSWPT